MKFTYPLNNWNNILIPGPSKYQQELKKKFLVKATKEYEERNMIDIELNRIPKAGETWIVDKPRCDLLMGDNKNKIQYVTIIKEIDE